MREQQRKEETSRVEKTKAEENIDKQHRTDHHYKDLDSKLCYNMEADSMRTNINAGSREKIVC